MKMVIQRHYSLEKTQTLTITAIRLFGTAAGRRALPISSLLSTSTGLTKSQPRPIECYHVSQIQLSNRTVMMRRFCSKEQQQQQQQQKPESFWQRIWRTYKTQTKVVLGVHLVGSAIWFACVYTFVSSSNVNLPDLLRRYLPERLHSAIPQAALDTLANPNVGAVAASLVLYKLIFPVRDLCTLLLTPPTLAALRRLGLIAQLKAEDRLRAITRDKSRETYLRLQRQAKEARNKAGASSRKAGKQ